MLAHVRRTGSLGFFAAGYLPVRDRVVAPTCLDEGQVEAVVIGEPLEYQQFAACQPGDAGEVEIVSDDTRAAAAPAVFLDGAGGLHQVRVVEVLMAAGRVQAEQINSTLYCCSGETLDGCVGNFLIVDERTGEVLQQAPRCHTC